MLITRPDGYKLRRAILSAATVSSVLSQHPNNSNNNSNNTDNNSNNLTTATISIYCATENNRGTTRIWNFYWIFFACSFGVTALLAVWCVVVAMRDRDINKVIKVSLVITLVSSLCKDLYRFSLPLCLSVFFVSSLSPVSCLLSPPPHSLYSHMHVLCISCFAVHCIDMLVDHWNFRGLMSRAWFQVIYWIEIDLMIYMYILTQWLW